MRRRRRARRGRLHGARPPWTSQGLTRVGDMGASGRLAGTEQDVHRVRLRELEEETGLSSSDVVVDEAKAVLPVVANNVMDAGAVHSVTVFMRVDLASLIRWTRSASWSRTNAMNGGGATPQQTLGRGPIPALAPHGVGLLARSCDGSRQRWEAGRRRHTGRGRQFRRVGCRWPPCPASPCVAVARGTRTRQIGTVVQRARERASTCIAT